MYIGSFAHEQRECWLYDKDALVKGVIDTPEAQERLFLEILGNAADNVQRSRDHGYDPKRIDVTVTRNMVQIISYGRWIPIEKKDGLWIPELIFGTVNTSSNYTTTENMLIGQNGIGAKATNVFSTMFAVECCDGNQIYRQKWIDNMERQEPKIESLKAEPYVKIIYSPDFKRFGTEGFTQPDIWLYAAYCLDVSFTCNIPVYFNRKKIHVTCIKDYAKLMFDAPVISIADESVQFCIIDTPNNGTSLSFVNGIRVAGGVHLNAVYNALLAYINEQDGSIAIRKTDILHDISVLISIRVPNPKFKSQTKEYLTSPTPKINIQKNVLSRMKKWAIFDVVKEKIRQNQLKLLKKTDGKRTTERIDDIDASDANLAGKRPDECVLILTEGKSAQQYAEKFISLYPGRFGRDHYGIIPLRGVPLNSYNANFERIADNKEFAKIKKFMGLKENMKTLSSLRYGRVWIMVDADNDGKHIAGLLLLFFMHRFPIIVENERVQLFRTPVVRATKAGQKIKFFTESSFKSWHAGKSGWTCKYYKGLASSRKEDIEEDFNDPNVVTFRADRQAMETLIKVFDKTKADERKQWLKNFTEYANFEHTEVLSVSDFIDHEMIAFSFASLERAIPKLDGFKEALRKAFYTSEIEFKKKKELKVAHLANATAQRCNYKYGEKSLCDAIATAAMDFVGANNEPIFGAKGIIGSRSTGKNESASRYIYVSRAWWIDYIFRKEDYCILERDEDEGAVIEYKQYYPILPTILFNRILGISTAYMTDIPCFNPLDLAAWMKAKIDGEELPPLIPWFRGHTGEIELTEDGFISKGRFEEEKDGTINITELPVRVWTKNYETRLSKMKAEKLIVDYCPTGADGNVGFIVTGPRANLGLEKSFSYRNITIINSKGEPVVFDDPEDLLHYFYSIRLDAYERRKKAMAIDLAKKCRKFAEKYKFIKCVLDGKLVVNNTPIAIVEENMKKLNLNIELLEKTTTKHFTKEQLKGIKDRVKSLKQEHTRLRNTPAKEIWKAEIDEYVTAYKKRNRANK